MTWTFSVPIQTHRESYRPQWHSTLRGYVRVSVAVVVACPSIQLTRAGKQATIHPSIHQNRYVSSLRFLFGKNKQTQAGLSKASKRNVTTNWNSIRGRFYYENYQHLQCFPSKQRQLQQADRHSRVHRFTQAQKEAYTALLYSFSSFCWDSTVFFFLKTRRASLGEWTGDDMAFPSLSFCFVLSSIRWLAIPKACRRWLISILEAMAKSDLESNDDGSDWCQTTTSSGVTHLRRRILQL